MATCIGEGKFRLVKVLLKIDFVAHPEGFDKCLLKSDHNLTITKVVFLMISQSAILEILPFQSSVCGQR